MRNVSAAYLEAIRARTRVDTLTGTIKLVGGTEVPLNERNILSNGVTISKECVTGEELEFGSVILSQLNLAIVTDQSRYVFYNAKVTLTYAIQLADNTWYSLALGTFKVAEAEKRGATLQLIAYDSLSALDKTYDGTQLYGTPYELLVDVCELCGLTFGMTEEEVLSMPNGDQALQIDTTTGLSTYRDCVKMVAQMLAAFAQADASGQLVLHRYGSEPVATLAKGHRYTPTVADFVCRYAGIAITSNQGLFTAYDTTVSEGLEMSIDAPAWDYGAQDTLQARTQVLLDELVSLQYTPCTFDMPSDPALECGDMLELETLEDEDAIRTIVTRITWQFRGRTSIESVGKNPYLNTIKPKQSQIIRELQIQTTNNKLIFYSFSNTAEAKISTTEVKQLASVTFVTVEDTSAIFLAQLPVVVEAQDAEETIETTTEHAVIVKDSTGATAVISDASGNPLTLTVTDTDRYTKVTPGTVDLQVFYYLNGALIEYQLIERMYAGPHILSLFYSFADLPANSNNTFDIRLIATNGGVTVAKRALRATITGQGLAATTVWDGTITIEEIWNDRSLYMLDFKPTTSVAISTDVPKPSGIVEIVGDAWNLFTLSFSATSEIVDAAVTVEQNTINPTISSALLEWTYVERYVKVDETGMQLKTSWTYQSAEQPIDAGRMTVVTAVTADLESVSGVEVSAD